MTSDMVDIYFPFFLVFKFIFFVGWLKVNILTDRAGQHFVNERQALEFKKINGRLHKLLILRS